MSSLNTEPPGPDARHFEPGPKPSKWCKAGKDAESHGWCYNRNASECHCTCSCHKRRSVPGPDARSGLRRLVEQSRPEGAQGDRFHATMGSGWQAWADQLEQALAVAALPPQSAWVKLRDGWSTDVASVRERYGMNTFIALIAGRLDDAYQLGRLAGKEQGAALPPHREELPAQNEQNWAPTPAAPHREDAAELTHYARVPFNAVCGADVAYQRTTSIRDRVTCANCVEIERLRAAAEVRSVAPPADTERLIQQAHDIEATLRHADVGPCTLPEGVSFLLGQRERLREQLDAARKVLADTIVAWCNNSEGLATSDVCEWREKFEAVLEVGEAARRAPQAPNSGVS